MSISLKKWSTFVHSKAEPLSVADIAYFRERLRNRVHDAVLSFFLAQSKDTGISKALVAKRLGKRPEQITRYLASPGNWTLDTVSDLLLALNAEPEISVSPLDTLRPSNHAHDLTAASFSANTGWVQAGSSAGKAHDNRAETSAKTMLRLQ